MTVDELQRELDTLAAQLEKDVATLKLKYAKRKQHLESVVRGKASYAAQGGSDEKLVMLARRRAHAGQTTVLAGTSRARRRI